MGEKTLSNLDRGSSIARADGKGETLIVCKCMIEYKRMGMCLYMCVLNFLPNNSSISWQSLRPS